MQKEPLTQRQNEAYEFIRAYLDRNHAPPTLAEIGDALSIASTNGVFKLLQALEKKGWIEREKHKARGLRLTDPEPFGRGAGLPSLPLVGQASSDAPDRLRERPRGYLSVDDRLLREAQDPGACLIGEAGDDGMTEAGIHKGDLLLIEEADQANLGNGTLVAALVDDQLLARTLHFADQEIRLQATDRHYTDETFPPDDPGCYIIGRLLGLIRTL